MIVLGATTQSLEVVLAGAVTTTQPRVLVCYRDIQTTPSSGYTPLSTTTATNNTTQVTVCAAPAANHQIVIDTINIYNVDTAADICN